jgi:hypothetical protein
MTMPADWADVCGANFLGRVSYRRIFHRPTGLDSGERVFLVVEPALSWAAVELNGQQLGEVVHSQAALRVNITELLEEYNNLEIVVEHPALDASWNVKHDSGAGLTGGLVGEVRLEIEE